MPYAEFNWLCILQPVAPQYNILFGQIYGNKKIFASDVRTPPYWLLFN
jgi:hypothetical protein